MSVSVTEMEISVTEQEKELKKNKTKNLKTCIVKFYTSLDKNSDQVEILAYKPRTCYENTMFSPVVSPFNDESLTAIRLQEVNA